MAVDVLGFRDSYIMIGQRGLKEGHAIEYVSRQYTSLSKWGTIAFILCGQKVDICEKERVCISGERDKGVLNCTYIGKYVVCQTFTRLI